MWQPWSLTKKKSGRARVALIYVIRAYQNSVAISPFNLLPKWFVPISTDCSAYNHPKSPKAFTVRNARNASIIR